MASAGSLLLGAPKYIAYDLVTRRTIEIEPNEYDFMAPVNGILISWIDQGNESYQISYYDDDGNHEYYDTWRLEGELYDITPDGYYLKTGEDENENPVLSFVSEPLEFLDK